MKTFLKLSHILCSPYGDRAAEERFITERYASIYRRLYQLTSSADAADDLAYSKSA